MSLHYSDVDSDEFFDADNELEGGTWPTGHVLEPRSVSVPVAEKDPEDIEEDSDLIEANDTSGKHCCVVFGSCVFRTWCGACTWWRVDIHTHIK